MAAIESANRGTNCEDREDIMAPKFTTSSSEKLSTTERTW